MSRRRFRVLAVALGLVGVASGCRDEPAPPTAAKPATAEVATGTAPGPARAPAMSMEEARKVWDTTARGLLDSFNARVFDPRRDGLLDHVEGSIAVRAGELEANYRFVFDSAHPAEDPLKFEVVTEPEGMAAGSAKQARRWALQACVGAYPVVAFYRPPTQLRLMPATDPKSKNLIVWATPFRSPLNVSYSFDERQVVMSRGEWTDEKSKAVTNYEWEFWHGRYLMRRERIVGGAELEFEYDDRDGVNLINRIHVRDGSSAAEAVLTYRNLRRRPS